MLRMGEKYRHLVHDAGCGCSHPDLQRASRRLEAFSRRDLLSGLAATALVGALPAQGLGQTAAKPNKTLLSNARLFDSKAGTVVDNVQVLISDNQIADVDRSHAPPPDGATVLDCRNGVIMPGLIDAHWHTIFAAVPLNLLLGGDPGIVFAASTAEAERTLMRGFTTVRDLGGPVFSFKQAIDAGLIPGPRIYPSGAMITTSGGHGDLRLPTEIPRDGNKLSSGELFGGAAIVDGVAELQLRVREQLLQGASQVKIVGSGGVSSPRSPLDMITFSEDELRAAAGVAADWNTYVALHAYTTRAVQRALRAGVTCIEHAHLIDEETAIMMAEKGVWLSTQPFLTMADAASQSGPGVERAKQIFLGTPTLYQYARKHGIKTAWGSDVLFSPELGPRQNIMLTHLSNWYKNAEVLQMATSGNAQLLELSNMRNPYPGKLGVIETGALADLVVVDGNPTEDLTLVENPQKNFLAIMKDGRLHKNTL
ncbi:MULTISPECIES: metal-dependent hydrolase family protein [unclassified Rhizobium]|jgi:imidazolonepropionase-like amidohydrolase|uniref:metal-dependent hydrolase family protein n=1 Tax=unclassified Rhizobium TaxID=2613769 RepID=UPI000DD7B44B|nr:MULTISPECIES: amidohydrolase family protein [unclassified Rhizobium]MDM9648567.1 amidohydrolase family protein [Rhizobium sp. S163]